MSKIVFNDEGTKGQIQDVTLCYLKLQSGDYKYQSTTEKEYSVVCVVDKTTAKTFKKAFTKNGFKEIDTEDFEDKYKIAPPLPGKEEQFIITMKTNVGMKSDLPKYNLFEGDPVPYEWTSRPKVYVPIEGGVKDITMTTLVSNGSIGTVAFDITENSYGRFPKLSGILVTNLIEYEQKGGSGCDFGEVVGGYNPGDGNTQQNAGSRVDELKEDDTLEDVGDEQPNTFEYDDSDIPF